MKYFASILGLVLLTCIAQAQTLTVHEWGTFTSLHGSKGGTLSGLYFEEEQLPSFVYHFPGFSPDPAIATNGYVNCKDVTIKMETPVLYFYSKVERPVQVHIDFPMGAISQWYPNRSGGEAMPTGSTVDFDKPERIGSIDWKAKVLSPFANDTLTQNQNIPVKWYSPRQTSSNLVKNDQGEIEKYLFYRGLANFRMPFALWFNADGTLSVMNTSKSDIPFIYIYDHPTSSAVGLWGIGPLASYETRTFSKPENYASFIGDSNFNKFEIALEAAGLNQLEAQALLNTWSDGYFLSEGFKVFWIVPRKMTDEILPLSISPQPDVLERVLVGKSEILTPEFEQTLLTYYKANGNLDQWKSDRYHLAYMQRVQELLVTEAVKNNGSAGEISIAPNPASTTIHILGISKTASVTIRNILGETVMNSQGNPVNISDLDIHNFPSGIYFATISNSGHLQTFKFVKR